CNPDRGVAHEPGLRSAHLGRRSQRHSEAGHAGDGRDRAGSGVRRAEAGVDESCTADRRATLAHRLGSWIMSAPEPELAISGKDLRKVFRRQTGETVAALDGVSLSVGHGGLTALVGPDGAGKTTLIRLFTALLEPDAGNLTVLGLNAKREAQAIQD